MMTSMRSILAALAAFALACPGPEAEPGANPDAGQQADGGDTTDAGEQGPAIGSIEVVPDPDLICLGDCRFMKVNQTRLFVAIVKDPSGKDLEDVTVTWSSTDEAIAVVDETGIVRGRGVGEAEIVARVGGKQGSSYVYVDAERVAAIVMTPDHVTLAKGETHEHHADAQNDMGLSILDVNFAWTTSDERIATVDANGLVTAVGAGVAVIWVTTERGGSATSVVTVTSPEGRARGYGYAFVEAGDTHGCGLDNEGRAACWGWNFFGQLGNGERGNEQDRFPSPRWVQGDTRFASLSLGMYHSCGLTGAGAAWCWGSGSNGELGATEEPRSIGGTTVPYEVVGEHLFKQISAGGSHTCAIDTDDFGWCWGAGVDGALGNGRTTEAWVPEGVSGGLQFSKIVAGLWSTCALDLEGRAYCWGRHGAGQVGHGEAPSDHTKVAVPTAVAGDRRWKAIHLNGSHVCALTLEGEAYCWGNNAFGQLGDGTTTHQGAPVAVATTLRFKGITTGAHHSCAITEDGEAWCWGNNSNAQFGDGTLTASAAPVKVTGGLRFTRIESGSNVTCGVTTDGEAVCWGSGYFGELGHGVGTEATFSPAPVGILAPQ